MCSANQEKRVWGLQWIVNKVYVGYFDGYLLKQMLRTEKSEQIWNFRDSKPKCVITSNLQNSSVTVGWTRDRL